MDPAARVLFVIAAFLFGGAFSAWLVNLGWESVAIQHSCAQYDPKTGAFTWVTPTDQ